MIKIRVLSAQEQNQCHAQHADGVGLEHICQLCPCQLNPFRYIEMEKSVQQQVYRNNNDSRNQIDCGHRFSVLLCDIGSGVPNHEIPCQSVGQHDNQRIQKHMDAVEPLLIIFNHITITLLL